MSRLLKKNILTNEEAFLKIDNIERSIDAMILNNKNVKEDEIINEYIKLLKLELEQDIYKEIMNDMKKNIDK